MASIALTLSGLLYLWFAAIFLYPIYAIGWVEAWSLVIADRAWIEWAAIAGIAVTATVLLVVGLSLIGRRRPPAWPASRGGATAGVAAQE